MIRNANKNDAEAIAVIYNHYILSTIVTFEEEAISIGEMANRLASHPVGFPWLVFEENNKILGYAYASKWKPRAGYKYSAESTVYLSPQAVGRGIGSKLYTALLEILKKKNFHAVYGGIALPNPASIALHEKFGFEKVAHFKEQGFKFDKWIDVAYWQLLL